MNYRLEEIENELRLFKENELADMYLHGRLGAKEVNIPAIAWCDNRCRTSFSVCRYPERIETNIIKLSVMLNTAENDYEYDMLQELKSLYEEYIKIKEGNIRTNKTKDSILKEIRFVFDEMQRLNTFKHSQNKYDNMISILKILRRYKNTFEKDLGYKPIFNTELFNIDEMQNDLLEINRLKFEGIRFQL